MVRGLYVQHFEVVVDDRSLGSVTQLATGKWMAQVSEDRRFGPFDTPTEARQAVVGWHEDRARKARAWRERPHG